MGHDNEEFDNGYVDDFVADIITVRLSVENGRIHGRVINDPSAYPRSKIVFPARSWFGPPPTQGEELKVYIVRDTREQEVRLGALLVERADRIIVRPHHGMNVPCPACKGLVRARNQRNLAFIQLSACTSCKTLYRLVF